ncbi:hypothetical protein [Lutibacter sp.]
MKVVFKVLLFIVLSFAPVATLYAQSLELITHSKDSSNNVLLQSIPYFKKHTTEKYLLKEVENFSKKLTYIGFLNNSYIINKKDSIYNCTFTLNNKIDTIRVYYSNKTLDKAILKQITTNYTESYFEVSTNNIENSLNSIVNYFENKGASFTSASLINLKQQKNKLIAKLLLNISEERKINAIIIKGYPNFPKKFINHYLELKQNTPFNLKTLTKVDKLVNTIPFINKIKKPEVLFTKDSTTLFIYLKKEATNKFDGIIGFSNKESGKLTFNGYLDLNLNNMFNKGELFSLNWKNNGEDVQTLNLAFSIPYIFNTRFSTSGDFSILKQDSTYVNTKSQLKINYSINKNNFVNATLSNEISNLTSSLNPLPLINDFKNTFLGLSYTYTILSNKQLTSKPKLLITAGYLYGNRTTNNIKSNQNKIHLFTEYIYNINSKHSLYLKNTSKVINVTHLLQNELYRIGGVNSIRGFDEQSIYTSKYSLTAIEYHYTINPTTHIYTITDFAILEDSISNATTKLYGIGVGYSFNTNYSTVNLSYAIGKSDKIPFNFNNSKVHIKITYPF